MFDNVWVRRLAVPIVLLWVALSLALIYRRGIEIGSDRNVADRYRYHAIPVAISSMYHRRPHNFTAYKTLAFRFQAPGDLDTLIASSIKMTGSQLSGDYYWAADD